MATIRNTTDLEILRELIDCLRLYEGSNVSGAAKHRSTLEVCLSSAEVRSIWETKQAKLEKLERGMLGLSYDYLGIKLCIAGALAREARNEGIDVAGLREQMERALACAGDGTDVSQNQDVQAGAVTPRLTQGI